MGRLFFIMVTIYDIAKATGFSAPTVSKALTGTGKLSDATRTKITEAAKKMGYEPNVVARTLTTKKSNLIGVIYDDTGMNRGFAHPLFSVVLTRFRECIEQAGYDLVFLSRHFQMSYYSHAKYRCVDGVIIINPATNEVNDFKEISDSKLPCITTNSVINNICTVITDNEKGAYHAAEYLIKHGHRKIAFLSAPQNGVSSAPIERFNGFKKALADSNIPFENDLFEESKQWDSDGGFEAFTRLYNRRKDFTAVFAVTDQLAFGVYRFAYENKIKLPDDISIIGFDDDKASPFVNPPLTTFHQDAEKIAEISAQKMLEQLDGKTVEKEIRVEAEFIERQSVGTI